MDDLQSAIVKIKNKFIPQSQEQNIFTPEHQHVKLYNVLSVFGIPDADIEEKVKFIYDYLLNNGGNPEDQIVSIKTKIGVSKIGETDVDRLFKYVKLQDRANKDLARYQTTMRDLDALSNNR
jgi:hypothetical protein